MAWWDIPARLFGRRSEMANVRRLSSVVSQAEGLLRDGDIRGVADLVGRCRRSRVLVTGLGATLAAWKHTFLAEPRDVDAESTKVLMEALRKTRFASGGTISLTGDWATDVKTFSEERVRELYMEGFRLQDLKRWGLGFERTPQSCTQDEGNDLKIEAGDPLFVWPIPQHELEAPGSEITPNESNK